MAPKNRGNYVKYQKLSNDEGYVDAQVYMYGEIEVLDVRWGHN